jgi:phytoene dehydrogenase-like protein
MHFARIAGENLVSPDEKSTGMGVLVFTGFLEMFGFGVAIGGSGELTRALIDCIKAHGGEVQGSADVARVIVSNGRAAGVELTDGRKFTARDAVIGAIHPHDLGKMVDGLDPFVVKTAERTQITDLGCITIHAALNAPLKFKAGDQVKAVMIELLPDDYDTLRKSFDDMRYHGFSRYPLVGLGSLSMHDSSRAPEGKATMHVWDYVTYDHPEGKDWDTAKEDYAQKMLTHMGRFIDNVGPGDIIARHVDSPVDMERTSSSFRRGDLHGVASVTYQSNAWRPTPELGRNTVPGVERLYLVGPFQYPGGGVFGAGRAAAMTMFDDLSLDFGKVSA